MKQELPLTYALKDGVMVSIDAVERGLECGCACPKCKQPLEAKKGEIRQRHFAHLGEENLHIQYSGTIPEIYSYVGSNITGETEFAISFDVSLLEGKINSNNSYFSEFYVDGDGEEHKSTYQLDNLIVSFGKKNGKAVMTISCLYGWFYFFFE